VDRQGIPKSKDDEVVGSDDCGSDGVDDSRCRWKDDEEHGKGFVLHSVRFFFHSIADVYSLDFSVVGVLLTPNMALSIFIIACLSLMIGRRFPTMTIRHAKPYG